MHPIFITGKMPAIVSVAFSSLSGRFKKSAKRRQAVKLEEKVKIPRRNAKIDNQTMHSMQTAIKRLQVELTSVKATIKDQGDKIKFQESQMNKKEYKS